MWKDLNSHSNFFVHKHGRPFIVLYINLAAVTTCENDLYSVKNNNKKNQRKKMKQDNH